MSCECHRTQGIRAEADCNDHQAEVYKCTGLKPEAVKRKMMGLILDKLELQDSSQLGRIFKH